MIKPKHPKKSPLEPTKMPGQEGPTYTPVEPTQETASGGNALEQGVGYEGGQRGGPDAPAKPGYVEPREGD